MPPAQSAATATQYIGASEGRVGAVSKRGIRERTRRDCRGHQQQDRRGWDSSLPFHQGAMIAFPSSVLALPSCDDEICSSSTSARRHQRDLAQVLSNNVPTR